MSSFDVNLQLFSQQLQNNNHLPSLSCPTNNVPVTIFGQPKENNDVLDFGQFATLNIPQRKHSKLIPEPPNMVRSSHKTEKTTPHIEVQGQEKTEEMDSVSSSSFDKKTKITFNGQELAIQLNKVFDENGVPRLCGVLETEEGKYVCDLQKTEDGTLNTIALIKPDGSVLCETTTENKDFTQHITGHCYYDENGNQLTEVESEKTSANGTSSHTYTYINADGEKFDLQDAYDENGQYTQSAFMINSEDLLLGTAVALDNDEGFRFIPTNTNDNIIVFKYGEGIISTESQQPSQSLSHNVFSDSSLHSEPSTSEPADLNTEYSDINFIEDSQLPDKVYPTFTPEFLGTNGVERIREN